MSERVDIHPSSKTRAGGMRMAAARRFRVADWTVEPTANRLRRGEQVVRLEPKVSDLLLYLASRPGQVISHQELETGVWAGRVVGYDTVTGAVRKLRRALGDDAHCPRIVETISKRGYRLIAPVDWIEEEPVFAKSGSLFRSPHSGRRRQIAGASLGLALIAMFLSVEIWRSHSSAAQTGRVASHADVRYAK
jgi:DNA-binding winged helix-turn-helix (wHTH) protein